MISPQDFPRFRLPYRGPGATQIVGFSGHRPLTNRELNKKLLVKHDQIVMQMNHKYRQKGQDRFAEGD